MSSKSDCSQVCSIPDTRHTKRFGRESFKMILQQTYPGKANPGVQSFQNFLWNNTRFIVSIKPKILFHIDDLRKWRSTSHIICAWRPVCISAFLNRYTEPATRLRYTRETLSMCRLSPFLKLRVWRTLEKPKFRLWLPVGLTGLWVQNIVYIWVVLNRYRSWCVDFAPCDGCFGKRVGDWIEGVGGGERRRSTIVINGVIWRKCGMLGLRELLHILHRQRRLDWRLLDGNTDCSRVSLDGLDIQA